MPEATSAPSYTYTVTLLSPDFQRLKRKGGVPLGSIHTIVPDGQDFEILWTNPSEGDRPPQVVARLLGAKESGIQRDRFARFVQEAKRCDHKMTRRFTVDECTEWCKRCGSLLQDSRWSSPELKGVFA